MVGPENLAPVVEPYFSGCESGELVALVGGSGEGKSLLLQSVLGLLPENMRCHGEIILDGEVLCARDKIEQRGKTLCYVPKASVL